MKSVKICHYSEPLKSSSFLKDQLYSVSLGNGYKTTFASKKETLAFLAQTNRDLSTKMMELNFVFSEIMKMYRYAWPHFENGKNNGMNNYQGIIKDIINGIENSFNLLVDRAGWENGNYTVFSHLNSIISSCKEICVLLAELHTSKNNTIPVYECESICVRLDQIYTAIVIYPQKIRIEQERYQKQAVLKVV